MPRFIQEKIDSTVRYCKSFNPLRTQIILVITLEVVDAARRHFQNAGGQRGHEFAVMGDKNQRTGIPFQRAV